MTVEVFSRLIKAGIGLDTALGLTNIALAVKSEDESLSTLDVAEIDLFSGEALILKAGAAPSFYTVSGRVRTVEPPSTPLGILNNVGFTRYHLQLRGGDMLVMVSDGMLGSGSNWLRDEIKAARNPDPREFSKLLLDTARRKCGGNFDDMTVVTLIMEEK
jgi:stage II sporulation protein E